MIKTAKIVKLICNSKFAMNQSNPKKNDDKSQDEYVKAFLERLRSIPDTPEGNLEVSRFVSQSLDDCRKSAVEKIKARDLAQKSVKEAKAISEV